MSSTSIPPSTDLPYGPHWPSAIAIADFSHGPRGVPARVNTAAPVFHGALSLSLHEASGTLRKFLITVESARFLRDCLNDVIGAHDSGLSYTDWHKLQDESRVQSASSDGMPNTDGSPADGQKQAPLESASAAASGEA